MFKLVDHWPKSVTVPLTCFFFSDLRAALSALSLLVMSALVTSVVHWIWLAVINICKDKQSTLKWNYCLHTDTWRHTDTHTHSPVQASLVPICPSFLASSWEPSSSSSNSPLESNAWFARHHTTMPTHTRWKAQWIVHLSRKTVLDFRLETHLHWPLQKNGMSKVNKLPISWEHPTGLQLVVIDPNLHIHKQNI